MTENAYLKDNYAPVADETTAHDLRVTGEIPVDLNGRLMRIGPNPVGDPGPNYHWFVGNGLVHGLWLRDGKAVQYRSRFVRDDQVCEVKGWPQTPGPRYTEIGGGGANTNVISYAGKTFAIVEAGGNPIELTDDLETVARSDFEGTLPGPFSAHPKLDPDSGELHVIGYYVGLDELQYNVVGTDGRVRKTVEIPVAGKTMVHDCSLTENYFIVFDMPVLFDVELLEKGHRLPYRWFDDYGTRVGLLPRDGEAADISWHEVDPCFLFHPLNSYEDSDGRVVLDVVRHPKMFATDITGPNDGTPTLDRWVIDPKGGPVKESRLDERSQEFPRMDERLIGKPYRYGYCGHVGAGLLFGGLLKHDLQTGQTLERNEGEHRQFQEPVFVPRHEGADEDDGWLLAYVHDKKRNAADVVILNAQDFQGEPAAVIELPERVPFGFHGNWAPEV